MLGNLTDFWYLFKHFSENFTFHMKAGIIAAGEGSRLSSDGISTPKPLVPVGGVPLIERLFQSFAANGISEIICIINEEAREVEKFLQKRFALPVRVIVRSTPSSMHSLFALAPFLTGNGSFLLSTVDSVYKEEDFSDFVRHVRAHDSADGILAVTRFIDDENPLYVTMSPENRILSFKERSPLVTGGLYAFSPTIFSEIDAARAAGIERLRNFLNHLIAENYRLEGFEFSKIVDVDHAGDIDVAEKLLRNLDG